MIIVSKASRAIIAYAPVYPMSEAGWLSKFKFERRAEQSVIYRYHCHVNGLGKAPRSLSGEIGQSY